MNEITIELKQSANVLTVGSMEGATERNKPFPRKFCNTFCCEIFRTKHCVNRNGGMHSCAARQEENCTLAQSRESHTRSSAHKKIVSAQALWYRSVMNTSCPSHTKMLCPNAQQAVVQTFQGKVCSLRSHLRCSIQSAGHQTKLTRLLC